MMEIVKYNFSDKKIVLKIKNQICDTVDELISSRLFREVVKKCVKDLEKHDSVLLNIFNAKQIQSKNIDSLIQTLKFLAKMSGDLVPNVAKDSKCFLKDPGLFSDFIEYLYNYWRSFDRFVICDSTDADLHKRPARTFNTTIEHLTHLIRGAYRDIEENLSGHSLRTYRQVQAGAEVAAITVPRKMVNLKGSYRQLDDIPVIRQVLLHPPLILDPPNNTRKGRFERVDKNPLNYVDVDSGEWVAYPVKVGELLIMTYVHRKFYELGFALCNLFEIASDEDLKRKPDAVYLFGVPGNCLKKFGDFPSVFYDDEKNDMLVAAVPNWDEFGYFGYLKKMMLTLHNIKMMKTGHMPFHGALIHILLKNNQKKTLLVIGDTGAGKSETLEAFRSVGSDYIRDLIVVADDMGSIKIDSRGNLIGYGTEIGAFLRLDDLSPGYAFGQLDRAIIMSPNKVNARIILPVTSFENIMKGYSIDYVLYANNYEDVDEDHGIIERFNSAEKALNVFKEGMVMSKGTTSSTGIVHSYFANIFGPPQYKELHEGLAKDYFTRFFKKKLFVGQIRTRLGINGWERKGPEVAAEHLLALLSGEKKFKK